MSLLCGVGALIILQEHIFCDCAFDYLVLFCGVIGSALKYATAGVIFRFKGLGREGISIDCTVNALHATFSCLLRQLLIQFLFEGM